MTYNQLLQYCNTEEIAIRCSSAEEQEHVRNLLRNITGLSIEGVPFNHIYYPYVVIYMQCICGWTGNSNDHPRQITYSEFLNILGGNIIPSEEEIQNLEDLL